MVTWDRETDAGAEGKDSIIGTWGKFWRICMGILLNTLCWLICRCKHIPKFIMLCTLNRYILKANYSTVKRRKNKYIKQVSWREVHMRICSEGRGRFLLGQDHEGDARGRERPFWNGWWWEEFRNLAINVSVLFFLLVFIIKWKITNGKR